MNENLSYSFHIGNDKNKTTKAKQLAKDKPTNFNNNAIQNGIQLSKVNHHNLRVYEHNQELIYTIKGSNDIVQDTKDLYIELFDEARINYNNKQTRDDRKIDNYFNKIANDNKHDLAVEIIIELGDMHYWEDKSLEEKYKMVDVFKSQVKDLEKLVPTFKVANATIHFDEHSPHMHIVGVPFKDNCKTGLSKQVGKSDVFTKDSLVEIQDRMREYCIDKFNKVYKISMKLKEKEQGRNQDYPANQMKNYEKLIKYYNKQHKKINEINKNIDKINNESNEVKEILDNLKQQPLNKNNVLLSNENKDKLLIYINDIEINNKNMKSIKDFNISLKDIKKDLIDNHKIINELQNEIEELKVENKEKDRNISLLQSTINNMKNKILELSSDVEYWKNKFMNIVDFFKERIIGIFGKEKQDKYSSIASDLYINDKIDKIAYNQMFNKNHKNKEDDLEL